MNALIHIWVQWIGDGASVESANGSSHPPTYAPVMPLAPLAVFFGAGLGALVRWWLNVALAPATSALPLGNLAANVGGGLLMGGVLALFVQFDGMPIAWRLAITTGFLGGLTTFSGFSAEAVELLLRTEYRLAALHILLHVGASLGATLVGLVAVRVLLRAFSAPA